MMIRSINDRTKLNSGLTMPWLGFGVYKVNDGAEVETAVRLALEAGYRHVVTIPRSAHLDRIFENTGIFDFELTPADMDALDEQRHLDPAPVSFDF